MRNNFANIFKGKVVIVGVGNTLRGDDGVGPDLVRRLEGKVQAVCIDAGSAPENYTGKIVQEDPETILIVDALHLGLSPGEYKILKKDDILNCGLSTHDISAKVLIEYLQSQTSADIYILGIQPENLSFGERMSKEVKRGVEGIAAMILHR